MPLRRKVRLWLWALPGRRRVLALWDWARGLLVPSRRSGPLSCPGDRDPVPTIAEQGEILDECRGIKLAYDLFRPRDISERLPLVVFSTGLIFGKEPPPNSAYLGDYLASHGYLVLHLYHLDSDILLLPEVSADKRERIEQVRGVHGAWDKARDRFLDISFLLDTLEAWNRPGGPLEGRVDTQRIGVSGYSYGARTALALLGERMGTDGATFADPRFKAGVLYAPSPAWKPGVSPEVFAAIDAPILHITGTRDRDWSKENLPEDRAIAYHALAAAEQYLLVLRGADHQVFSGDRDGGPPTPADRCHHAFIKAAALAFWDAQLKGDETARRWLNEDFAAILGREGKFLRK